MNMKNNQKTQKILNLLLVFTLFVLMSGCVDSEKPSAIKAEPSPTNTPAEENQTEEAATPTSDNSKKQSNIGQKDKPSANNDTVTHNSFGKVKIGMTVSDAARVLGTELVRGEGYRDGCYYVEPKQGYKGVRFMVTSGAISRIDIESREYATDKGAKIGDTEAGIKELYKGIEVFPNKYDEKKHNMEVYSDDKQFLINFETDGNRVTGFRVGKAEEAGWVEGCS